MDKRYLLKKDGDDIPVDACKGWTDSCEYCDKRFGVWNSVDEDIYGKIPEKAGFFMIALQNKKITEVVSLLFDSSNIQKSAIDSMDNIKELISNKKSKATKSSMFVRWMVVKKADDKDNYILCAHWCNNGILPKFLLVWPGMNLLEGSEILGFSKHQQKWCYLKKNPVWRKQQSKPHSSKIVEELKKCNLQSCEVCDSYFTPWKSVSDVIKNDFAPQNNGLVMFSIVCGKTREVVLISSDIISVVVNIKDTVKDYLQREHHYIQHNKFINRNTKSEVRWMVIENINSDNSCFLYAHWLNAEKWPMFNYGVMPGRKLLNNNIHFVVRNHDKQWMYEVEVFRQAKKSKVKNRRRLMEELDDEDFVETVS